MNKSIITRSKLVRKRWLNHQKAIRNTGQKSVFQYFSIKLIAIGIAWINKCFCWCDGKKGGEKNNRFCECPLETSERLLYTMTANERKRIIERNKVNEIRTNKKTQCKSEAKNILFRFFDRFFIVCVCVCKNFHMHH